MAIKAIKYMSLSKPTNSLWAKKRGKEVVVNTEGTHIGCRMLHIPWREIELARIPMSAFSVGTAGMGVF